MLLLETVLLRGSPAQTPNAHLCRLLWSGNFFIPLPLSAGSSEVTVQEWRVSELLNCVLCYTSVAFETSACEKEMLSVFAKGGFESCINN